jgi:hypothetical protein
MDQPGVKQLIGEVAKRHNLLLPHDDPVFAILTLNELALGGLIERVEAAVEAAQDQVSAGAVQQREAATALAQQVISGGAEALAKANAKAAAELQAAIKATLADELAAVRRAAAEAREARQSAWQAALAAAGVVCLLIGAAAASWFR